MSKLRSKGVIILACFAALVLLFLAARYWLGPEVPGYRVESRPLVQTVVATGRVVAVSRAQVGSEITGVVVERRVKEGDIVSPGDVLAVLRSDQLSAQVREAQAALDQLQGARRPQAAVALREAEAQLEQARREAQRRRELLKRQAISREDAEQAEQAEILARAAADRARLTAESLAKGKSEEALLRERLQSARAALAKSVVRSEVAGTVLTRNAEPGDLVQPGRVLFEIARSGDTEILLPVDEKNLGVLRLGQSAQCIADAYPGQVFPARVTFIAPGVDAQRGTVDLRLKVDPVPAFLRQDMTVSVNIETGRRSKTLAVPNDALTDLQGDRAAVAAVRDGKVENVPVALGLRGLAMSEIVSGLSEGELVLVNGAATPKAGERVRVVEQKLPDAGSGSTRNELPMKFN